MKKKNLLKECENYFVHDEIEEFKIKMGIVDEENIVPDEDLVKIDEKGNIIEE